MLSRFAIVSLCMFISGLLAAPAAAQDMRVYTSVSDVSRPGTPRVVSHSLTLFHAGKVYDYMEETGDVVIFEPVHHRFVILGKDFTATELPFSELNHALEVARTESLNYLDKLKTQPTPNSQRLEALVNFQLTPEFQENRDDPNQRLELTSSHLIYNVKTAKIESPQFVRQYLDYADWAARLNFVLRPNSTYPQARLKLNDSLRKLELLPTQVDLQLQMVEPVKLRAEHQFAWEFMSVDRKHISHWERTLRSAEVRWVPFQQFQQQTVAQHSR